MSKYCPEQCEHLKTGDNITWDCLRKGAGEEEILSNSALGDPLKTDSCLRHEKGCALIRKLYVDEELTGKEILDQAVCILSYDKGAMETFKALHEQTLSVAKIWKEGQIL